MPRVKTKPEQTRENERRAWELRTRGWTQDRIARELKLTQAGVSLILKRVVKRVLKDLGDDIVARKVEQEARLEHVVDEMMQAWERSKPVEVGAEGETVIVPANAQNRNPEGDPRFIEQYRNALADIRKIWGVDAPTKLEHGGKNDEPIKVQYIEVPRSDNRPAGGVGGDAAGSP